MFKLLQVLRRRELGQASLNELNDALIGVRASNLMSCTNYKTTIELPALILSWHRNESYLVILDSLYIKLF